MTTVAVTERAPAGLKVDVLALGTVPGEDGVAALVPKHGLAKPSTDRLASAVRTLGVKGEADEVVLVADVPGVNAPVVALVGLGREQGKGAAGRSPSYRTERLRRAAGAATRALAGHDSVALVLGGGDVEEVSAVAEGALLGAYAFTAHKSSAPARPPVQNVLLYTPSAGDRAVKEALARATTVTVAQNLTRDLVNTAPNVLYPQSFAERVQELAKGRRVAVEVMDEAALEKAGCGGTLCVGQGSARPPRIVTMTYAPRRAKASVALVGKGITFDSGGLWIKPGASMTTMKCDMAGAAAVAATVLAAADLRLPVAVTGYLCLAENMIGPSAMRPGDVITTRGGKTVEIINPDAEGRLVLLDGIVLAGEQKPDAIVDVATLTGMAVVALGHRTSGLMGNDEALELRILAAAGSAGEQVWSLPMLEEARGILDSTVADIKHHGEREGGAQIAARFLQEFVPDGAGDQGQVPWAHLDIAGPAFNEKGPYGHTPKGGTGASVRTLVNLVESFAS